MTAPVRFCLCAHPRALHKKNPFTGQHSGPCKPSCNCLAWRPSPRPTTAPTLEFDPAKIAATEAAG